MKTSPHQFEMLITYMEQHGDLSKPSTNARGRIGTIEHWEKLCSILNSDGSGDTKSTDKWKKVWSDYKNNTKKKAARIHRAAIGTGGGQAVQCRLTDLEQRVLNLIGVQVATGLAVEEAGLVLGGEIQNENTQPEIGGIIELNVEETQGAEAWNLAGPSTRPHINPPMSTSPHFHVGLVSEILDDTEELHPPPVPAQAATPPIPEQQPARAGQTTPLRRQRRTPTRFARRSPRRPVRQTNNELAAQRFLNSDNEWRDFKMQQHRETMEMRREENRVREMQIQVQRELQSRVLDILDKLVNKYCSDRT